jgi:hypothetical protein
MTVTGDWFDIDYFTFVEGKDATDPEPIGIDEPIAISKDIKFHISSAATYQVFDLAGTMLGAVDLASGASAAQVLKAAGYQQGVFMLKQVNGNKKFMTRVTK